MRVLTILLLPLMLLAEGCAAPGREVLLREGDFALIEVRLQG